MGVFSLRLLMGGAAYRGSYFSLGKSKQNRVLCKTRVQGGTFKVEAYLRGHANNFSRSAQTVAQDGIKTKHLVSMIFL